MTLVTLADGTQRDIDLDSDAVCAYEADHPDWSILDLIERMDRMRFTDLNLMATFLGFRDYEEAIDLGVDMERMADLVQQSKYMGFMATLVAEERD